MRLDSNTVEIIKFLVDSGHKPHQPIEIDINDERAIVTLRQQSLWANKVAYITRIGATQFNCEIRRTRDFL